MTQIIERKPSPLLAMHARYEETMSEFVVVEQAETDARKQGDVIAENACRRAQSSLCAETDALRLAILHQVPDSWTEAMVLQFHIVNAYDMVVSYEKLPDNEQSALQTAIDTLFDFMCCEVDEDHEKIGSSFQDGAIRAFHLRRRRTGIVEA